MYTRVQIPHIYALFVKKILKGTDPYRSALVSKVCQLVHEGVRVRWVWKAEGFHAQAFASLSRTILDDLQWAFAARARHRSEIATLVSFCSSPAREGSDDARGGFASVGYRGRMKRDGGHGGQVLQELR